jgi:hypothetical protein
MSVLSTASSEYTDANESLNTRPCTIKTPGLKRMLRAVMDDRVCQITHR